MKFIDVNERVPVLGDYYYCKVDTKQDCIIKTVVEFTKFQNGNYGWDLENVTHFNEFGEDAEVIEWLDENYNLQDDAIAKAKEVLNQYYSDGGHFYGDGINQARKLLNEAS